MHDSLPTMLLLKNREITSNSNCRLYNIEEEPNSHMFLHCPFAIACCHGSPLAIHTTNLLHIIVQHWLRNMLASHNLREDVSMEYMQAIFTTLWTIRNHRYMVVHEGKEPNPMEVVLTYNYPKFVLQVQRSFLQSIRFKQIMLKNNTRVQHCCRKMTTSQQDCRVRRRKAKRSAWAYAKHLQGVIMFCGVDSNRAISTNGVV